MFKAAYVRLHEAGLLRDRAAQAVACLKECRLCPRQCGADRTVGKVGFCGIGRNAVVASAQPHFGEESEFPWSYDEREICYFLEGDVVVTPDGGKPVQMGQGDLVTFPAGMSCVWKVRKAVRKHYRFG